jgi:hypothetical protein
LLLLFAVYAENFIIIIDELASLADASNTSMPEADADPAMTTNRARGLIVVAAPAASTNL